MARSTSWLLVVLAGAPALCLAAGPWLIAGGEPASAVPDEFYRQRLAYTATVEAAQTSTADAQRRAPSTIQISSVQTMPPAGTPDLVVAIAATPRPGEANPTSHVVISSVTPQGTRPPASQSPAADDATASAPPTPAGMDQVEDILTEIQIADQLRLDAAGSDLTEIGVQVMPDAIHLNAQVAVLPGVSQGIVAIGIVTVAQSSLVAHITDITLGGRDVTAEYAGRLESRLNTSFYRLLPQRYVQQVVAEDGQLHVWSLMR